MNDAQIKHMVDRFLGWRLPENFNPDCGIHFDADAAKKLNPLNHRYEPVGTNLFSADQATAMVRYMVDGTVEVSRQRLHSLCVSKVQRGNGVTGYRAAIHCSWCQGEGAAETHAAHCPLSENG